MDSLRRDARLGRPLRLLWLIDSLTLGGAERLAVTFAREAAGAGIDLRICCLKRIDGNAMEAALAETGVRCDLLDAANLRDWRAFARLRRLLRNEAVDVVHAHLTYASIWGAVAARLAGVPCVTTLHVSPCTGPAWGRQRLRERIMCGLLNRTRAQVIAVSAALRDRYVRRRLIAASRVHVVRNGVDADRCPAANPHAAVRLRRLFGLPRDARVLMTTAVLRDGRKGLHVLLDALPGVIASCPSARLVVVGCGPLLRPLQAQALRLRLGDHVVWAGARSDVPSLLAGADLFVHPALEDAFPTAVLEAMAAALPVVASFVDGLPEMIADGVNGRLVPADDPVALSKVLTDLLADPCACVRFGAAARRTVLERFSVAAWVRALRNEYVRALDGEVVCRAAHDAARSTP